MLPEITCFSTVGELLACTEMALFFKSSEKDYLRRLNCSEPKSLLAIEEQTRLIGYLSQHLEKLLSIATDSGIHVLVEYREWEKHAPFFPQY
jgi:hypothetical protein